MSAHRMRGMMDDWRSDTAGGEPVSMAKGWDKEHSKSENHRFNNEADLRAMFANLFCLDFLLLLDV
jgi:hypothetical protein